MKKPKQLSFLKAGTNAYGGVLRKTRKGRQGPRAISTKQSMHLVLRSSQAKGKWSFLYGNNDDKVIAIIKKFAQKFGVKILSLANVGNHIHMHLKFSNRFTYKPFIKAITGAIAIAVTGRTRRRKGESPKAQLKFWDYRPFTRIVIGFKALLKIKDYLEINRWESMGFDKELARTAHAVSKVGWRYWNTV